MSAFIPVQISNLNFLKLFSNKMMRGMDECIGAVV